VEDVVDDWENEDIDSLAGKIAGKEIKGGPSGLSRNEDEEDKREKAVK